MGTRYRFLHGKATRTWRWSFIQPIPRPRKRGDVQYSPVHLYSATNSVSVLCDSELILTLRIYGSLLLFCGWFCHKGFCLHAGIIRNWNRFQFILQVIQGLPRGKYTYCTLKLMLNYIELRVCIHRNSHGLWMWHVQAVGVRRVPVYVMTTKVPMQHDWQPLSVNAMRTYFLNLP